MVHAPDGWRLVMPVKGGRGAKSRLGHLLQRLPGLPEVIALDSVEAALACRSVASVHVVCADVGRGERLAALGAVVVRETAPGGGLLPALDDGLSSLEDDGRGGGRVAVLLADVPCLLPGDLAEALAEAAAVLDAGHQATVPDAEGTGTVLLAGRLLRAGGSPGDAGVLRPRFGPGSALAHRRDGARPVGLALPRLRRDVDTPAELEQALALGAGPRTTAALAAAHPACA